MANVSKDERVQGGIYGALVGDALGVPVEFTSRSQRALDPVVDMRAGGTWGQPKGTWSDDGAMLLCTMEALTTDLDDEDLGGLFVDWMTNGYWAKRGARFDIGGATSQALSRVAEGCPVAASGLAAESSNGNGSLMRILPVALRYADADRETLVERVRSIGGITHAHPRSQLACVFYSLFVVGLLHGESVERGYRETILEFAPYLEAEAEERDAFRRIMSGEIQSLLPQEIEASGYVIHTLEAALWCLLNTTNFSDATLRAVNLGEDTDTTGCVVGGAAGVAYGFGQIPRAWVEAVSGECESLPGCGLADWVERFAMKAQSDLGAR